MMLPFGAWVVAGLVAFAVERFLPLHLGRRTWALASGLFCGWWWMHGADLSSALVGRGWPVALLLAVALTPERWRDHVGVASVVLLPLVPLWTWGSNQSAADLAMWAVLGLATLLPIGFYGRVAARGSGVVVAIAALSAVPLVLMNGSVRLGGEAGVAAAAMLALATSPLGERDGWGVALACGASVWFAVLLSDLGWSALVPLLCLSAFPTAQRPEPRAAWWSAGVAAAIALVGLMPTLVDWVQDPPVSAW
jgi:hypothetical protein